MRLAPSWCSPAMAAVMGLVQRAWGLAARRWPKTRCSPMTMVPEVQPNATTCSATPGTSRSTAPAMSFSMAASEPGEMTAGLGMRAAKNARPGTSVRMRRHSYSMVWSLASTTSPMAARAINPASIRNGKTVEGAARSRSTAWRTGLPSCLMGQPLQAVPGRAPADDVADDAGSAAGHRPAHVAMPGVQKQVAMARAAQNGRAGWRHRAQAGPVLRAVVVRAPGKQLARQREHAVEVLRHMPGVVAGELGRCGQTQTVAEPCPGHQVMLVYAAQGRRLVAGADRQRHRIALDRINGQAVSEAGRQDRNS